MQIESSQLYQKMDFVYGGQFQNKQISQKLEQQKIEMNGEHKMQKSNNNSKIISHQWNKMFPVGPGFSNLGNTCFMNAVLQCLSYTPSLANYLLSGQHKEDCQKKGKNASNFCSVCLFQEHISKCFPKQGKVIQPLNIVRNMRYIFKRFRLGRQEDSHEFLRLMVESLQRGALPHNAKLDNSDMISKIFNGKLKSQVKCLSCGYKSEIFENFLDLSLDLKSYKELNYCMDLFFQIEELNGKNKYKCSGCKKFVNAQKRFLINEAPNVLTCHLKRFTNNLQKINRFIQFPSKIDINKYMCPDKKVKSIEYELFGVLVHQGGSCFSGHYYSYIKNSNGQWYRMDDSLVQQVGADNVMKELGYLLFYAKKSEIREQQQQLQIPKEIEQKLRKLSQEGINQQQIQRSRTQSQDLQNQKMVNGEMELENGNLINGLKKLQNSEDSQKYMKAIEDMFDLTKKSQKQQQQKQSLQTEELKQEESKGEQKLSSQIEVEEQKYQENAILIPGDIRALRPLLRSKLNRRKYFKLMEQKWFAMQKIRQINKDSEKLENQTKKAETTVDNYENDKQYAEEMIKKAWTTHLNKKEVQKIKNLDSKKAKYSAIQKKAKDWEQEEEEEDDDDKEIKQRRNQILEENPEYFTYKQKTKDEYDVDYDKGKLKKIKKKKEQQHINFQQLYDDRKQEQVNQ